MAEPGNRARLKILWVSPYAGSNPAPRTMKKYFVLLTAAAALLVAGLFLQTMQGGGKMKVEKGDTVAVDYLGFLDNGTVFDTSIELEAVKAKLPPRISYVPLEFTVGAGQMIKGFDEAVIEMQEGEDKIIHLEPADAYGEKRQDLIITVPRSAINGSTEVGSMLVASNGAKGKVIESTNETVTIDMNHELAGQALNFKITMKKITKK